MNRPLILTVWITAHVTACSYNTTFKDCEVRCTENDMTCPDGLVCGSEGLCRTTATTTACATILIDAGIDTVDASSDAPPQFSSCIGVAATCGATASEDCCISLPVPGGTFYRSHDVAGDGTYSDTSYPATVSSFTLDKYEVTVGRFRMFVESGRGTLSNPPTSGAGAHTRIPGSGWDPSWNSNLTANAAALSAALQCDAQHQTWTTAPGANESLPINCVSWYEAFAFCIWDGGYLPTEAEWNYAAAGGGEQRAYPWSIPPGSTMIDCSYANYDACGGSINRVGSESPKGDAKWGHALGGNVWEWVLDQHVAYSPVCDDCAALAPAGQRVNRGGAFSFDPSYVRTAYRGFESPASHYATIGVRCAR